MSELAKMKRRFKIGTHNTRKLFLRNVFGVLVRPCPSIIHLKHLKKQSLILKHLHNHYEQTIFFIFVTKMLRLPLNTVSISCFLCSLLCTSHTDPLTLRPISSHSCRHLFKSPWLREHVWTVAPNAASSSTVARLK